MTSQETVEIHIRLLNEGTETARATEAVQIAEGLFKVLPTPNYDPEDETWEFLPGSVVECKMSNQYARPCLLAVKKIR
ncbi:MAG TPA: hypothetical protein DCY07_05075 [Rhodospirillaceae bacterium]|nr:hypothetical protein [Rhodospirillaceae bacterium]